DRLAAEQLAAVKAEADRLAAEQQAAEEQAAAELAAAQAESQRLAAEKAATAEEVAAEEDGIAQAAVTSDNAQASENPSDELAPTAVDPISSDVLIAMITPANTDFAEAQAEDPDLALRSRRQANRADRAATTTTPSLTFDTMAMWSDDASDDNASDAQSDAQVEVEAEVETEMAPVPVAVSDLSNPVAVDTNTHLSADAPAHERVHSFVQTAQGARLDEIENALGLNRFQVVDALRVLIKQGKITQRDRVYNTREA
ncbi:MAG: hypothetical protein VKJ64_18245, partial [Leptolyngbyaceae bacterium]|nr:hypothetical protein [Leptolyngbyaceae bacterium]